MEHQSGKLRTRSQAAPDWTVQDSLILVNEISAVEGDCLNTLSSFQKWKIIVQNCNALEVHRTLNQCKRKWDSLLSDYKKIKKLPVHVGFPENFDGDLFKAIDDYVKAQEGRSDTDPDSDPDDDDEADLLLNVIAESVSPVSKKQKRKLMPQKRYIEERGTPRKNSKSEKRMKGEPCSSGTKVKCPRQSVDTKIMAEESSPEEKVEMMTAQLLKNAERINAVLSGELGQEVDYRLADLKNSKAIQTDITRRKGDELIACLGNSACALNQLCQLLQQGS